MINNDQGFCLLYVEKYGFGIIGYLWEDNDRFLTGLFVDAYQINVDFLFMNNEWQRREGDEWLVNLIICLYWITNLALVFGIATLLNWVWK